MFRLPVSCAPAPAAAPPKPPRPSSRSGVVCSVVSTLPLASHNSCTLPNDDTGTRYENGSVIRVTRKCAASAAASTERIIAGVPTRRTVRLATSSNASCPVVWYLRSA